MPGFYAISDIGMAVAMQQEEQDKLYDEQNRRQEDQDRLHDEQRAGYDKRGAGSFAGRAGQAAG